MTKRHRTWSRVQLGRTGSVSEQPSELGNSGWVNTAYVDNSGRVVHHDAWPGANRQWNGGRETPMTAVGIAALICELVEIDKMGVDDDFFRVDGKPWERWHW